MLDRILYQFRKPAIAITLLFCAYIAYSLWVITPFSDFIFYWRPDDQLAIEEVPEESLAAPYLEPGDIILAIDGKKVHRSASIYTGLSKTSYEYTIQRGEEVFVATIPFSDTTTPIGVSFRLPAITLAFVFLLTGIIVIRFAQEDNPVAIRVAYIFMISAISVTGLQGELLSVTGAWIARLVWFPTHVGTLYLGFVPHVKPLSSRVNRFFKWALVVAGVLSIVSFLEGFILFPQQTSFDRLVGIGPYELALLLSSIAWIAVLVILIMRAVQLPAPEYEKQQIRILLYFIALAIVPVTFLTLIPRALLDIVLLPFPVAIALFVLVPAGFFFVIHRRGYLGLDIVFSKTTIFLTTALILLTIYSAGLYFINYQFDFGPDIVLPATLMVLPILLLTRYVNQPVDSWVSSLFYGSVTTNRSLPEFATALRTKPELTTLEAIVKSVADDFQVPHTLLVLGNEEGIWMPVAQVNVDNWRPKQRAGFESFHKPLLRSNMQSKTDHLLFAEYQWLELLIPVIVRNEQIGFLAMSRPKDGYFNAKQILFLSRVADMIAVGSEAILLFEASRKLSLQLLSAQEVERKHLATQIHDRPLQTITFVHHNLRKVLADPTNCKPEAAETLDSQGESLQEAMTELREICAGLYPPVIEQGLELVVEEVTSHFEDKFGLDIEAEIDLPIDTPSPPEIATAVYRILTESLNNVVKHSQTYQANVNLLCRNAHLSLTVADQGVGSTIPSLSITELTRQQHLGIRGMFEWASLVNGRLSIESNQPQGTKVVLEIPLNNQEAMYVQ